MRIAVAACQRHLRLDSMSELALPAGLVPVPADAGRAAELAGGIDLARNADSRGDVTPHGRPGADFQAVLAAQLASVRPVVSGMGDTAWEPLPAGVAADLAPAEASLIPAVREAIGLPGAPAQRDNAAQPDNAARRLDMTSPAVDLAQLLGGPVAVPGAPVVADVPQPGANDATAPARLAATPLDSGWAPATAAIPGRSSPGAAADFAALQAEPAAVIAAPARLGSAGAPEAAAVAVVAEAVVPSSGSASGDAVQEPGAGSAAHPTTDAAPRAREASAVAQPPVQLASRGFGEDVANRVLWMASQRQQVAELRIDPPQLGPLEVRLSIENDQASLSLLSAHGAVRDALQAHLPRLQEMLLNAGVDLVSVHVGTHDAGQQPRWSDARAAQTAADMQGAPAQASAAVEPVLVRGGFGLVDVYA
jgi:flagellar hook-length control protein FliK